MSFTQTQSFVRFLVLLCFSLTITISSGATTISVNQPLSGDYTIISEGEQFELGFFKPGNSANYYIGIWYKKIKSNPPTIVWVANRETPISDRFRSELKIIDGNLVLLNESKSHIWSTNVTTSSTTSKSATAVILDDGNLVLRDSGSNSVEPAVWQSFDHPTHTWLPGAKFGYDNRTKKNQVLTSWRSKDDPGVGLFSFELQPSSNEYVIKWNGSHQYWTSGAWNGKTFDLIPEMRLNYIYNFSYHMNENESYFTYSVYNPSIISRNIMDVSGQLQQLTWLEATNEWNLFWSQPRKQCEVYALCGSFGICRQSGLPFCNCLTGFNPRSESEWNQSGFSSGCVRKTDSQCWRNTEKQDFLKIRVKNLPPNNSVAVGSAGECRTTCMNDYSCNAYSFVGTQCLVWDGDLLNLSEDDGSGNTIYIKVASKDLPHPKKSNLITAGVIAGLVGGAVLVLGLILVLFYVKKRVSVGKTEMVGSLVAFAYKDIKTATKNFSDKLGGGGFGSVFKGVLHDSSVVAVKKLESISQGEKQFRSEVSTMGIIQHVHLVRLRGFCAEGNNKLLVYDYMEKGSLDTYLFCGKQVLNWETRYQIALGIARGLVYLHDKCRDCIIHCDIKPDNILLDANFQPKIADFGLAKLVGRDFSRVLTTTRGSMGYLAPEWISGVAVTAKADVYSYGMMLFELVHGKRNVMHCEDSSSTFYPGLVSNILMKGGDILSLLDSRLNREACVEQVTKIFKVACWCIQDEEERRPTMSLVERILEGVSDVNMPPIPQIVNLFVENTGEVVFFTDSPSNECSLAQSNSWGDDPQLKSSSS
ncbi:G-type lectin S-receptor-like serine/threonine-protein kinase At2g19130 [Lactuca sativa]|uniref:Receptor-like serine/threonine-protein kinase n=1 Tax=Lactuca sativa TaxID=4236 RepID=A0A9R1XJA1_LACSA|nr:G-type lectin S-receptor-like serine/threonine-protein kinase At2g19130 [Lactuca sativa]KAJ0215226.1 hypothetical protein LSAT_V11C300118260 [Lactuca sativa]